MSKERIEIGLGLVAERVPEEVHVLELRRRRCQPGRRPQITRRSHRRRIEVRTGAAPSPATCSTPWCGSVAPTGPAAVAPSATTATMAASPAKIRSVAWPLSTSSQTDRVGREPAPDVRCRRDKWAEIPCDAATRRIQILRRLSWREAGPGQPTPAKSAVGGFWVIASRS